MSGYRAELAWTCVDYAETLQYKKASRDRRDAKSLLNQASTIAEELRMFPLLRRIQSLVSPAISVAVDRDRLTPKQVEVLLLVAAGDSDQKIADELVLARSTVSNHVKNIRDRIGGENRTEAVAIARELGLLQGGPHQLDSIGAMLSEGPAVFPRSTNALVGGHHLSFDCSSDCTESPLNTSAGVR